jgi:hypothetical protein
MGSPEVAKAAFEPVECDAVHDWVQAGGSLLMIADHHPWGASSGQLAKRLGVEMGMSTTFDPANSEAGMPARLNSSGSSSTRATPADRCSTPRALSSAS